ncbi:MAG: HD domain-containing protein [Eubacteriales bacterium]|nr:HD domain-containing protein [Eubacteriales bacterium]
MKNKKRIRMIGLICILISTILLLSRLFVRTYDTGDVKKAYLTWGCFVDVSQDRSYAVINDGEDMIYYVDWVNQSVKYILQGDDIPVDHGQPMEVCLDEDNNLYLLVVEMDDSGKRNLAEHVLLYDANGKYQKAYKTITEESDIACVRTIGVYVVDGTMYYVKAQEDNYAICSIDLVNENTKVLAEFEYPKNANVQNATYDQDGYVVNFTDGSIVNAKFDGSISQIARFNFKTNDGSDDNVYPDMCIHVDDQYYFLDKKYFDCICSLKDNQIRKEYTLAELYDWDPELEQNDYRAYHDEIVDNSIAVLDSKEDTFFFASNANLFVVHDGEMRSLYATDDGLLLPTKYMIKNIYKLYGLYVGIILGMIGLLTCLYYIIRYRFKVLYKTLVWLIPSVVIAFSLITVIVVNRVEKIYLDDAKSKLVAISSLVAASMDKDLIHEIDDLDDITNGNAAKIMEQLKQIISAHAEWGEDISFNLYEYDQTQCNYIIIAYPQEEREFLNTYFLQTEENLQKVLVGKSNTAYSETFGNDNYFMDAITIIYDKGDPIALLDVYEYMDKMNEDIRSLQHSIIVIAVLFTGIVIILLVIVVRYITTNLEKTSQVIEKISSGDLEARVEKLPKDEIGIVGQGINDMAKQLKELFEEQAEFSKQVIESLVGTIDAKDKYTNGHSIRVAQYSVEIARRIGKSEDEMQQIYYSALLHDIGKIGVPDDIINKKGKLTDDEFGRVKTHPEIGYEILSKLSKLENISIGAYAHHERIDGNGYPLGLKGDEIPELARIICVADTYDAMTSNRSYRKTMPQDQVRSELERAKGTQLDARFAQIMLDWDIETYPNGYPD